MIKWLERIKVEKESGHVTYFDVYVDTETGVQYIGHGDSLTPRYNSDGTVKVQS